MGGLRRIFWRRAGGALGLVGLLVYMWLIPGHFASEVAQALVHAELGDVIICHGGGAPSKSDDPSKPGCPFCHHYASFQLAALGGGTSFVALPSARGTFLLPQNERSSWRASVRPQSRGPPPLPV